jgi:hypothetical protein
MASLSPSLRGTLAVRVKKVKGKENERKKEKA